MPSDPKFPALSIPGAEEFRKLLGDMKLPALPGTEALMQAHQRNFEALTAANRIALEGAQAVARRHMEIMQQTMAELTETLTALASPAAPQDQAAKQAELLKSAYEKAVANSGELADLIQRANGEAVGTLNARVTAAIDELTTLIGQTKK
jgi:phasin family protein